MPPPAAAVSAGAIAIDASGRFTLSPDLGNNYPAQTSTSFLWTGGSPVTFTAAGDTVPRFSGTLVAPDQLTLTAPPTTLPTLRRDIDLDFTWALAPHGTVRVSMSTNIIGASSIACNFAAANGSGVLPATALAELASGPVYISADIAATTEIVAGRWGVDLSLSDDALTPSGDPFSWSPTLD
jgi:hypothetical protein